MKTENKTELIREFLELENRVNELLLELELVDGIKRVVDGVSIYMSKEDERLLDEKVKEFSALKYEHECKADEFGTKYYLCELISKLVKQGRVK